MKEILVFMQELFYKKMLSRVLIIIFILLVSKINTYALENTFSRPKGIYLGPYSLRYNPTIYFEENQISVNTDVFGDTGVFFNRVKVDSAFDFHLLKIGLGYRGAFYDVYNSTDLFASVNLRTPISGFHIGAGYIIKSLFYNSIVDLSGEEYTFDQSLGDIVYSINYRNDNSSISFVISGVTPIINTEIIIPERELPPLEITMSYLGTGFLPNFKLLLEVVTINQAANYSSQFNLSLIGAYDYSQNFSILSGLNFDNGYEGVNLGIGAIYNYENIYFSYGYRIAFALNYIGNHELSFVYKFGWGEHVSNAFKSMTKAIYGFLSPSPSSSSSEEKSDDDDDLF